MLVKIYPSHIVEQHVLDNLDACNNRGNDYVPLGKFINVIFRYSHILSGGSAKIFEF